MWATADRSSIWPKPGGVDAWENSILDLLKAYNFVCKLWIMIDLSQCLPLCDSNPEKFQLSAGRPEVIRSPKPYKFTWRVTLNTELDSETKLRRGDTGICNESKRSPVKTEGLARNRTWVLRIRISCDNHYTTKPYQWVILFNYTTLLNYTGTLNKQKYKRYLRVTYSIFNLQNVI